MKRLESEMDKIISMSSSDFVGITLASDAPAVQPKTTTAAEKLNALFFSKGAKDDSSIKESH
jgi:hypothetical protein